MNRLSFGIKTAPSEFNRIIDQILSGLVGVMSYFDDIIVFGISKETCYQNLIAVLERLKTYDLHLNEKKCEFFKEEIAYLGHIVKFNSIQKDPRKVEAILKIPTPTCENELRQFLGMITYYSRFIPNLSTLTYPFRKLLCKNNKWKWISSCEVAFNKLKKEIASERVLMPFNPELPLILASDASPTGIAGILSHIINDIERPIAFISRSLTQAEQHYSQLDREALAIVFSVQKFFMYLFGKKFKLITDNRALTHIFHQNAKLPAMTTGRLLRYAVFLSSFDYEVIHRKAEEHVNVDFLSRTNYRMISQTPENDLSEEVKDLNDQVINQISSTNVTCITIAEETMKDPELSKIKIQLFNGSYPEFDYSLHYGIVFKGNRVVIPKSLQLQVLNELHYSHVGIVKMKQLARRYCYWKTIDIDIEKLVKSCGDCALVKKSPAKVPTHSWDIPKENFERIHIDYAGEYLGHYFLVLVDSKSKWLEVKILRKAPSSDTTIKLLLDIFSFHGFPSIIVSDNASIFTSEVFKKFCSSNGIRQKFIAPGHPATNGLAERSVQTIKKKLASMSTSTMTLHEKVREILFRYRATPLSCKKTPAELYLGRNLRTQLDAMIPKEKVSCPVDHKRVRQFCVGERVQARWYEQNKNTWRFGIVLEKLGRLHYKIRLDNGYIFKRHINQLQSTLVQSNSDQIQPKSEKLKKHVTFADQQNDETSLTEVRYDHSVEQQEIPVEPRLSEISPESLSEDIELENRLSSSNNEPEIELLQRHSRPLRQRKPPPYLEDYVWENCNV